MKKIVYLIIVVIIVGGIFVYTNKGNLFLNENKNLINETNNETDQIEENNIKNQIIENTPETNNEKMKSNETIADKTQNEFNPSKIIGVWQYPDSTLPEEELIIKSVASNKITFDYVVYRLTSFENVTAELEGNTAVFDVKNEGDWNIKGTMLFEDDKVTFNIKESSTDLLQEGTSTTFLIKSDKSVLE